eukprot:COSAG02_NODE_3541_length_6588_cov_11.433349_4_plen_51_part_00
MERRLSPPPRPPPRGALPRGRKQERWKRGGGVRGDLVARCAREQVGRLGG